MKPRFKSRATSKELQVIFEFFHVKSSAIAKPKNLLIIT